MQTITGVVQHYAWGSPDAIPDLLDLPSDGRPWAELWFGTHSGGPAMLVTPPVELESVTGPLPYLAKFLAAAAPLSLQVHPSAEQAAAGFAAEEAAGIALTASERTFKDPYAKPEVMIAVTPFEALCGFHSPEEIAADLGPRRGGPAVLALLDEHGIGGTVTKLLRDRPPVRVDHPVFDRLDAAYPGDPGAVVALLLHHVTLAPGEAVFLPAGELHMYLEGLGVEVMGASDNVLRGGLTVKHIDIDRLGAVMNTSPRRPPVLRPDADGWYDCATEAFAVQQLRGGITLTAGGHDLLLVVDSSDPELPAGSAHHLTPGETVELDVGLAYRVTHSRVW